ncbi:FtsW/RodA/SpoVE family cell cycle protein [Weissella paramesenteroides]|jgi:cell division protein FtsW|uniref:Probable peptidoglycan glycosyltransferase FtsW n=2 Tax=Weissella paramesenteroides TaxID=1249 RepID=C5RBF9_WEIPA|nr:FtsW/RodA/SpoVE family cell cycle protein [Weissella paramesenteroides]ATF41081.1 FtsW/RodA/SpoVE family cell cycle protein [Weissella paramesenteroides]EER74516.1 cell cycle protein, FtsW/RodA/SpoVE family [Weissella paramesenteroides ATCC 33313]MCM6765759.1 FtsW/RodA/SpoVE family cell cycle protein [Weissella paramesenteroides]MCM6767131.1 FtsW/RodA/SpoVE family cell cycle protein [Weissella paramesenteroides]MCM6769433.1 FtsW/RodA/SpoVE family cell cycle protein [Weissella paramesenteroi
MEAKMTHQHRDEKRHLSLMGRIKNKFRYLDLWLLIPIIAIMIFGDAMVYTSSTNMAIGSASSFLIKQAVFGFMSLIIMLFIFTLKINWQSKFIIRTILGINIILLISLAYALLFGQVTSGAKGWIYIGSFGIQPVEYFKISMILYIAHRFSRKKPDKNGWFPKIKMQDLFIPFLGMMLVFLMPDFGGIVILLLIFLIVLMMAGVRMRSLLALMAGVLAIYIAIPFSLPLLEKLPFFHYQIARFEAYVNPWVAGDSGHQLINSYYAISNGGLFGRGLGNSIQKTGYLPEPNTDFIMAIVGEELGAITICIVLIVFAVIICRLVIMGIHAHRMQQRLVLYGIATYVVVQILINLGGVVGILPITGVTFPMVSYGGSSLLSWGITFGVALNIIGQIKYETELEEVD